MEHKHLSDALKHSPPASLTFQADKFTKKSNFLNIPDTIHEQASAELSGDSLKMEACNDFTKSFEYDKENINNSQQVVYNEPSNNSEIAAINNSFIKNCERKLLENSNSDEEQTIEFSNKSAVNKRLLEIPSKLVPNNDTISTPPSTLRREISILRSELAAADEFHDLEIQVLNEEKSINKMDMQNYLQVLEKNAALMELYTNLKNEYEEYRKEQEKIRHEFQSRTADCLESLCSQIEASDSSLNISSTSFVSFNTGIKSSTMMEDISEVEATVMHDATVLINDPLSLTCDGTFKTPMQTPLRSAKKLFPHQMNMTSKTPIVKDVKEIIDKRESTLPVDSEHNIQLLNLETALQDKVKEIESLEQRLFKLEDVSDVLKIEYERTKEHLTQKSQQLNELTQKLLTETISLNPALRDSLIDATGPKLLHVFIETIMEKCKNIQDELIMKHSSEKTDWEAQRKDDLNAIENLQNQIKSLNEQLTSRYSGLTNLEDLKLDLEKKLSDAESTILTREVEMRILQTSLREAREDAASSAKAFLKLESQLSLIETTKKEVENRCLELEETVRSLKVELESKEKLLFELDSAKDTIAIILKENEDLKQIITQSEETIAHLKSESLHIKEELMQEIEWLKNKETSRFSTLFEVLEDCKKTFTDTSESFLRENSAFKLFSEKLQKFSDPQLSSAVEAITEFVKIDWNARRKTDLNVIENLQNQIITANERNMERESKLSQLLTQVNEINKINEELKIQLCESESKMSAHEEEICRLKNQEDILKQLKSDLSLIEEMETSNLPSDRIAKLISEKQEVQKCIETGEGKIVAVFIETLTKTCKGVQNEFLKKIESTKVEWESLRNEDQGLINALQTELNVLTEKSNQQEIKISEINLQKEDLIKLRDNLTIQMAEAQKVISTCNEEIRVLRCHENTLKKTKEELAVADETIVTLKSQLASVESVKIEVEGQCQVLQETIDDLKRELDSNASLRLDMDRVNVALENMQRENEKLKQDVKQSEQIIHRLELESCQHNTEELLKEIEFLKGKENSRFTFLCEVLKDTKRELQKNMSLPENAAFELISTKLRKEEDAQLLSVVEAIIEICKIESDIKKNYDLSQVEVLQNQIRSLTESNCEYERNLSDIIHKNGELDKLCENLKIQLRETENRLLLREEEISILKKQEDVLKEIKDTLGLADETIFNLNSRLSSVEEEKKEVESRCLELEETVRSLKVELESKEKLLFELDSAKDTIAIILKENEDLKQIITQSEETIAHLKSESLHIKEELMQEIESLRKKEASRFNIVHKILEDCKSILPDTSESFLRENSAFKLFSEKLQEFSDPQLSSAVEAITEFVKIDWNARRKTDLNVIENLQNQIITANERNMERESKLSQLLTQVNEINKINEELKIQLCESESKMSAHEEEICRLKNQEDILKQLKSDLSLIEEMETSNLPSDRIAKLISEKQEVQKCIETGEGKIVAVFIETLTKTCKGVQNEFLKKIESTKVEWESLRNEDQGLINALQTELNVLTEKSNQQEIKISEINLQKEDLIKLRDNLTNQMAEAQKVISTCNEEIRVLRCHENTLKKTKEELAIADETIITLKSELASTKSQKGEIELRCRKLEEVTVGLQAEVDTKETILKGLDELKFLREKMEIENSDLKLQILQSEDVILDLKKILEVAREEQGTKELRIKGLLNDVEVLKKEKENLMDFSEKLEKLEKNNKSLMDIFSDVQSHLDLPEDTMTKLLSGKLENKKIFSEKINSLIKTETEGLRAENKALKLGNENLKEKVKQLTKLLCETSGADIKEELSNLNTSQANIMSLRSRSSKNIDLCVRRLDKLEDINHNLMELLTRILTMTEFPNLEKLRLCSVRDFANVTKKVEAHINSFQSRLKELKEENATLDEECETYSNIIKDLKKEAAAVWRSNKEKTEAMESDISRLKEEKTFWEKERQELLTKISRLEGECQKLKSATKTEGPLHSCVCGNESKKINDLKRTILIKEQKLLELQDLEAQTSSYKSQIEYLKSALDREKKKVGDEKDKNKKLQNELNEMTKKQKSESKKEEQNEILDELRMRGSLSGGVVQEFVDKEKMRKLSKDIGILKELCRARYVEIKRLEAVNASLRNKMPK